MGEKGLFRRQAVERQLDRLHGDVLMLPKLSHSLIIVVLLLWVVLVAVWLIGSTYARKETVLGWLEPSEGVVRIYAESAGTIKKILVSDGDHVEESQPLMIVNGDHVLVDGNRLEALLLHEYEEQKELLTGQLARSGEVHQMREHDIEQRIKAANEDLLWLNRQATTLDERYSLVKSKLRRYKKLKTEGHIAVVDFDAVVAEELALRSDRQALSRNQVNQRNLVERLETEKRLLPEEYANNVDQIKSQLSDIARQIAQLHGQRAHIIKATRSGVITNLQAREGQQTQNNVPLLYIVPGDAVLNAHLLVPVRSAGFVETGQQLDIRYDAFPYEKFGIYTGIVSGISDSVLLPNELLAVPIPVQEPVYRVEATLSSSVVNAYGHDMQLKPGMTLSADVRLSERTIMQWLLEPIYTMAGRL